MRGRRRGRAARLHDAGQCVVEIEVLPRDTVDVLAGDALDALEILVGRGQAKERERIRPDRGEFRDRVALKLRRGALLEPRGLDQLGRHSLARDACQDGAYLALE